MAWPSLSCPLTTLWAGADITGCFFLDTANSNAQVAMLAGLTIAAATDGRSCLINGMLTGVGPQNFTVRALSGSGQEVGQDEVMVVYTPW